MSSGMDDVFGNRSNRPVHPDFWRISEVVLANDAPIEEASTDTEREQAWRVRTGLVVDRDSVTYMAIQRSLRVDREAPLAVRGKYATLWIDAFVAGAQFERAGGHREPARDLVGQMTQVTPGAEHLGRPNVAQQLIGVLRQMDALRAAIDDVPAGRGTGEIKAKYREVRALIDKMADL
jgi:hypothetical protein